LLLVLMWESTEAQRAHCRERASSSCRRNIALPEPVPAGGQVTYLAERAKALASCPRKRENYERYMRSTKRLANPDYLPIRLDIE
jgi:hypothetical protein